MRGNLGGDESDQVTHYFGPSSSFCPYFGGLGEHLRLYLL